MFPFSSSHTHTHNRRRSIGNPWRHWLVGASSGQQRQRSYIVCILIEADGKFSDTNKCLTLAANLCWDLTLILTYYIVHEQRCYIRRNFNFTRAIIFVMGIKRCGMRGNKWKSGMSTWVEYIKVNFGSSTDGWIVSNDVTTHHLFSTPDRWIPIELISCCDTVIALEMTSDLPPPHPAPIVLNGKFCYVFLDE